MEKLRIQDIEGAARAVRRIQSIDETIERLGRKIEVDAQHHGEAIRKTFGPNILTQIKDEDLGKVTFCAIINALLLLREDEKENYGELVEFPPPPCPKQVWPNPDS
jgi:hypothetical protein